VAPPLRSGLRFTRASALSCQRREGPGRSSSTAPASAASRRPLNEQAEAGRRSSRPGIGFGDEIRQLASAARRRASALDWVGSLVIRPLGQRALKTADGTEQTQLMMRSPRCYWIGASAGLRWKAVSADPCHHIRSASLPVMGPPQRRSGSCRSRSWGLMSVALSGPRRRRCRRAACSWGGCSVSVLAGMPRPSAASPRSVQASPSRSDISSLTRGASSKGCNSSRHGRDMLLTFFIGRSRDLLRVLIVGHDGMAILYSLSDAPPCCEWRAGCQRAGWTDFSLKTRRPLRLLPLARSSIYRWHEARSHHRPGQCFCDG
jgi:hypothetical protein